MGKHENQHIKKRKKKAKKIKVEVLSQDDINPEASPIVGMDSASLSRTAIKASPSTKKDAVYTAIKDKHVTKKKKKKKKKEKKKKENPDEAGSDTDWFQNLGCANLIESQTDKAVHDDPVVPSDSASICSREHQKKKKKPQRACGIPVTKGNVFQKPVPKHDSKKGSHGGKKDLDKGYDSSEDMFNTGGASQVDSPKKTSPKKTSPKKKSPKKKSKIVKTELSQNQDFASTSDSHLNNDEISSLPIGSSEGVIGGSVQAKSPKKKEKSVKSSKSLDLASTSDSQLDDAVHSSIPDGGVEDVFNISAVSGPVKRKSPKKRTLPKREHAVNLDFASTSESQLEDDADDNSSIPLRSSEDIFADTDTSGAVQKLPSPKKKRKVNKYEPSQEYDPSQDMFSAGTSNSYAEDADIAHENPSNSGDLSDAVCDATTGRALHKKHKRNDKQPKVDGNSELTGTDNLNQDNVVPSLSSPKRNAQTSSDTNNSTKKTKRLLSKLPTKLEQSTAHSSAEEPNGTKDSTVLTKVVKTPGAKASPKVNKSVKGKSEKKKETKKQRRKKSVDVKQSPSRDLPSDTGRESLDTSGPKEGEHISEEIELDPILSDETGWPHVAEWNREHNDQTGIY